MIFEHDISSIIAAFGGLELRWYGLLFATGILLNYLVLMRIFKREGFAVQHLDSVAVYLFFGLLIGARLGHVFFIMPIIFWHIRWKF